MLDVLKDLVQNGIIDGWPTDGQDLLLLVRAIGYFRRKALWAAVHVLEEIDAWHAAASEFLARYVPKDVLMNTAVELYHNSFGDHSRVLLLLGSLLGQAALEVPQYYANVSRFITRVVGLRYEDSQKELAALQPGMLINLVREPENRYDPHAVAVVAPWGARLGYLRASLAAMLTPRYAKGEVFFARVVEVMGPDSDPNEQLYIEVWSERHSKEDLMPAGPQGEEVRGYFRFAKRPDWTGEEEADRETSQEGVYQLLPEHT